MNKLRAYELQDQGLDTVDANLQLGFHVDPRTYDGCAALLKSLGVGSLRLVANNPRKLLALESHGIRVVERIPLQFAASAESERYLVAKRERWDI